MPFIPAPRRPEQASLSLSLPHPTLCGASLVCREVPDPNYTEVLFSSGVWPGSGGIHLWAQHEAEAVRSWEFYSSSRTARATQGKLVSKNIFEVRCSMPTISLSLGQRVCYITYKLEINLGADMWVLGNSSWVSKNSALHCWLIHLSSTYPYTQILPSYMST